MKMAKHVKVSALFYLFSYLFILYTLHIVSHIKSLLFSFIVYLLSVREIFFGVRKLGLSACSHWRFKNLLHNLESPKLLLA